MSELWPLALPAAIVVTTAVVVLRSAVRGQLHDDVIDLRGAPPVPADRLVIRTDLPPRSPGGPLAEPDGHSLGGRLRSAAPSVVPSTERRRVAVRRRRRPLSARGGSAT